MAVGPPCCPGLSVGAPAHPAAGVFICFPPVCSLLPPPSVHLTPRKFQSVLRLPLEPCATRGRMALSLHLRVPLAALPPGCFWLRGMSFPLRRAGSVCAVLLGQQGCVGGPSTALHRQQCLGLSSSSAEPGASPARPHLCINCAQGSCWDPHPCLEPGAGWGPGEGRYQSTAG